MTRLGVIAPPEVPIDRREVRDRWDSEAAEATAAGETRS